MGDVYDEQNRRHKLVHGLALDRFEAGRSATDRPSRWNQEEEDRKAELAEGLLKRGVELAALTWSPEQRLLWKLLYEDAWTVERVADLMGVDVRSVRRQAAYLRKNVDSDLHDEIERIQLTSTNDHVVKGTLPQRRRKPHKRRITRSESLNRIKLPGHEQELHWLKGGSWIDLLDTSCRSNPTQRRMTEEERAEYLDPTPGMAVLRPMEGE